MKDHDASPDELEPHDPLEVLTIVAHDMRTPLTALLQALRVIASGRAGAVVATQERFLRIALKNSESLLQLVSRVHEAGRLDCGAATARFARHDAWAPARSIVASLADHAAERGVELVLAKEEGCATPDCWADEEMVGQLLLNLVGNALKFTPRGGRVTVSAQCSGLESGWIEYAVRDTGPGIPPAELSRVFEKFYQVQGTRRPEGTGLGLAICRGIARAHGGAIGARNNDGRGCTVWAVVPQFGSGRAAAAQLERASREARARGRQLSLIVLEAGDRPKADLLAAMSRFPAVGTLVDLGANRLGIALAPAHGSNEVERTLQAAANLAAASGLPGPRVERLSDDGNAMGAQVRPESIATQSPVTQNPNRAAEAA